jgi:hypothetical protein
MAKVTYSLNSLYSKALHGPVSSEGYVLYPKIASYNGEIEGDTKAYQSEKYKAESQRIFNSPTNIRKIWLTGKHVAVQYYGVPKTSKNTGRHFIVRPLSEDLFDIGKKIISYSDEKNKYLMEKAINSAAVKPDEYLVNGNGIGISNPYTCNNVEEIYFDWTMLLSDEVKMHFGQFGTPQAIYQYISKQTGFNEVIGDEVKNFFWLYNSGGARDLRKRFPRLKIMAMITNLDDIIATESSNIVDMRYSDIKQGYTTWYTANKELIASSGSMVIGSQLPINKENSDNYNIKSTQYRYDDEVLKGLVAAHTIKLKDFIRKEEYGETTEEDAKDDVASTEMTDVEKYLLDVENKYGDSTLRNVLICSTVDMPVSQLKEIFSEFTKPNRARMAKMIGFNIQ